jgi:hypothetical protein
MRLQQLQRNTRQLKRDNWQLKRDNWHRRAINPAAATETPRTWMLSPTTPPWFPSNVGLHPPHRPPKGTTTVTDDALAAGPVGELEGLRVEVRIHPMCAWSSEVIRMSV